MRMRARTAGCRRGFALLSVLWGVALIAMIASLVLSTGLAARRGSHIALERAQAEALADAAINDAIFSLLARQPGKQHRVDGVPYVFEFDGTTITVAIQDENGKIDLNNAGGTVLVRLLTTSGASVEDATAISDRIQDWRGDGANKSSNGAIADEYRAAGYDYGPRKKPFQSVGEVKLVLGMTPDLFRKIEPALTVYSHRGSANSLTAPRQVLAALDVADGAGIDPFIANRDSVAGNGIKGGVLAPSIILTDWAFTIRAELAMPAGGRYWREAAVRFTNDPQRPYWILAWREMPPE